MEVPAKVTQKRSRSQATQGPSDTQSTQLLASEQQEFITVRKILPARGGPVALCRAAANVRIANGGAALVVAAGVAPPPSGPPVGGCRARDGRDNSADSSAATGDGDGLSSGKSILYL